MAEETKVREAFNAQETARILILWGLVALSMIALGITGLSCYAGPRYNVWRQEMLGRAALARANYESQTVIARARADVEAARIRAAAVAPRTSATQPMEAHHQVEK